MVSEFIIENQTTQDRATFGQDITKDFLFKSNGLNWGYAQGSHSSFYYPGQVGSYISMTSIKERTVMITGYCYYVLSPAEISAIPNPEVRRKFILNRIEEKKEYLNGLINPLDYVRIIIGDYYLQGKPQYNVIYGNTIEENNEYFCMFSIEIYCNNPMFRKKVDTKTVLTGSKAGWHFPLAIPTTGFIFSTREEWLIIGVENEGNVEAGAKITLEAKDEIVNPTLTNLTNGQQMVIRKTMEAGEKIIVNTNEGNERGIIGIVNGVTYNYFRYWDFDNTWLRFPKGTSLIGYSTDNGNELSLNVSIDINPEKYALENM